ncbi:MAG: molybdopterin-dependent oxidoreductase [Mycobacterium sp.]
MTNVTVAIRMLNGLAAGAVAVGLTTVLAAPFGLGADALNAVGSAIIDGTPGSVKEWAIQTFGTSDKLFLSIVLMVVIGVLAAAAGLLEARRAPAGSAVLLVGGAVGCAAVLSRAGARPMDIIPVTVGSLGGVAILYLLSRNIINRDESSTETNSTETKEPANPTRRPLLRAAGLLGLGLAAAVGGTALSRRLNSVAGERSALSAPRAADPPAPPPPDVQPTRVALPNFVTSNADFYRIDTALNVPQLSRSNWRLRIHGSVNRELTYTFADLQSFPVIEKMVTLTCVSNEVGGKLVSNAVWTGYRTRDLLSRAGIRPDADMVLSTSVDGFTVGTPIEALTDDRDALLAIAMNGEPLPTVHGYPARLVVPGLYGYVSATKWVVDLELTRFDRAQAYWTRLGWAAKAPIKTASRIDVPRSFQKVPRGPVRFGGVAWAQNRGVRAVEVRIDNGPWDAARPAADYSNDTWRLWSYDWVADAPGSHTISVRATDNAGAVQPAERRSPMPDGATGWHTVTFSVT